MSGQSLVVYKEPSEHLDKKYSHVGTLTLNNPPRNILTTPMLTELREHLYFIDKRTKNPTDSLRTLVVTSEGDSGCGADINELVEKEGENVRNADLEKASEHIDLGCSVIQLLDNLPIPTIGAMSGLTLGGSAELYLACDLLYADKTLNFAFPEVPNVAVVPGWRGPVHFCKKIGYSEALKYLTTGERIGAETAKRLGIIMDYFENEDIMNAVYTTANRIALSGPIAVRSIKEILRASLYMPRQEVYKLAKEKTLETLVTKDCLHGVTQFFRKDKSRDFKGE